MDDAPWTKFTWNIKNFSKLNTKKLYSDVFSAGGYEWRVLVFPNGNSVDYLSIYLDAADSESLSYGWNREAKVILRLINQMNKSKTLSKETRHIFNAKENDWGYTSYIPLKELYDPIKGGYVVNDTCIIEAEVAVVVAPWTKFTWNINNFSKLNTKKLYSDVFSAEGYKWRVLIFPKGNSVDYLSIYLDAADSASLSYGWNREAKVIIRLINQMNKNKTLSKETRHIFNVKEDDWGYTSYIPLNELNDPFRGYVVNDTCIIEAEVAVVAAATVIGDMKKETVTQNEGGSKLEIQCVDDDFPLPGANSRRSFIAPPPENIPNPSSTLKNRSNIAHTLLQSFMSEFDSDIPTYEKFGKVMEDLRTMMYGGNMGDIFEEWRPRILEIEALLAEIEDMEQESKVNREAPLLEELSKILESLAQSEQVSTQAEGKMAASLTLLDSKRQELQVTQEEVAELRLQLARLVSSVRDIQAAICLEESVHAKSTSEKEEAEEKIKNLKQQKKDLTKNIEDVQTKAVARGAALAEKKVAVQEWLSNPFPTAKNP